MKETVHLIFSPNAKDHRAFDFLWLNYHPSRITIKCQAIKVESAKVLFFIFRSTTNNMNFPRVCQGPLVESAHAEIILLFAFIFFGKISETIKRSIAELNLSNHNRLTLVKKIDILQTKKVKY